MQYNSITQQRKAKQPFAMVEIKLKSFPLPTKATIHTQRERERDTNLYRRSNNNHGLSILTRRPVFMSFAILFSVVSCQFPVYSFSIFLSFFLFVSFCFYLLGDQSVYIIRRVHFVCCLRATVFYH